MATKRSYTPQEAAGLGLGWVDPNHPNYGQPGYVGSEGSNVTTPTNGPGPSTAGGGAQPATNATGGGLVDSTGDPPSGTPAAYTAETLNGMAGYRMANGGWVPGDHPLATGAGAPSVNPNGGQPTPAAGTPGATPGAGTPGAGTPGATDTAGTVRNAYLDRLNQSKAVDRNDPIIKNQVDAFSAQQQRASRDHQNQQAERLGASGMGSSGAMDIEGRMASERAGQATGSFEAELMSRELQTRRNEISEALQGLHGMVTNDQKMALERELAQLDAAIKREGIAATSAAAAADNATKNKLGTGALNVDMLRALIQNKQFGTTTGVNIGQIELDGYLRSLGL